MTDPPQGSLLAALGNAGRVERVRYRIVVEGELGARFAAIFEGMELAAHDGRTEIVGVVEDQSALQGLLARIASHGLVLISVAPDAAGNVANGIG